MSPESFLAITNQLSTATCLLTADGAIIAANNRARAIITRYSETRTICLHELVWDKAAKIDEMLNRWSTQSSPTLGILNITNDDETLIRCQCKGSAIKAESEAEPPLILLELLLDSENHSIVVALNEKIAQADKESHQRQRAEDAFHKSERSLRLLVDAVKDYAIIMLDPQGLIISWNSGVSSRGQRRLCREPGLARAQRR